MRLATAVQGLIVGEHICKSHDGQGIHMPQDTLPLKQGPFSKRYRHQFSFAVLSSLTTSSREGDQNDVNSNIRTAVKTATYSLVKHSER